MRVSVCEFLRLTTQMNWFYANPGHWISSGGEYEAKRENPDMPDTLELFRGKRHLRTLEYFEGLPSHEARNLYHDLAKAPTTRTRKRNRRRIRR